MPAPVLEVRIRIVAMRIQLLASYFIWCTGSSSAYGSGTIRELYTLTIAPADLIQYRLSFMRLQCESIDAMWVRIPASLLFYTTFAQ
jgi:hypothetical protein